MENKIRIAINHLKVGNFHHPHIDMAIEALEKQIPLEPESGTDGGFDWYCKCGNYISDEKMPHINYCLKCGQKLNWN